jgi:asparagine synthase (glutamine-hydrolysing)
MTAIAGLVGVPSAGTRESACRASLDALKLYGSRNSVRITSTAAFGVNLYELVPDDRFDDQPYHNERFLLVADVRIDNRDEMLAALGAKSIRSRNCSDAEILFRAWCRWQERCLDTIVGDYAFAVHDRQSGSLTLARDPVGQRPLFYARHSDVIFFASMASGLLPHRRFGHDRVRMAQRLMGQEEESRRSYFEGVARVLSGELVVISGGQVTTRRWNPRTDELRERTREDLVVELRDKFDSAVAARLRRIAGPVATHLSSGYDSSAVTATAARMVGGDKLIAFTSAPARGLQTVPVDRRNVDESDIADQTARFLGIEHEVVRTKEPLLDSLREHTRYYQEPVRNVLNMGWWAKIEQRASARGATLLLTGETGNLTLSAGGLTALADWVRKGSWRHWQKEAISAWRRPDVSWRGILINSFRLSLPERVTDEFVRLFLGQPRWSAACFVRPEMLREVPQRRNAGPRTPALERLHILQAFDAGVFRKGSLAKHGIDERDATADRRLVEFALRLPPEHLLDHGTFKPLARAILVDRVPKSVLDAPLRGYQGADWISRIGRDDSLAALEEISGNSTVQEVIDLPRLRSAITNWPNAEEATGTGIESFGRHVTNALAMGVFIRESEQPAAMGV